MIELLGYAAFVAVLATFMMRTMLPLRLVAILSNVLFLSYGYLAHVPPVLFLRLALLPINVTKLVALRERLNPRLPAAVAVSPKVAVGAE